MKHLSDRHLLLNLEGELPPQEKKRVQEHLEACWKCRARARELESAIADFITLQQQELIAEASPSAGPRALLKGRLSQLPPLSPSFPPALLSRPLATAAACGLLLLGLFLARTASRSGDATPLVSTPDSRLTPGAALLASRQDVCAQSSANNKIVPVALQKKVFEEYGIRRAQPEAYEVDYLVTPALGGADDIHNLWPHSYSATVWNAQVKDALEDRLREMVCGGSLDLSEAQREIATNWIAAYKKYFHTDQPLSNPATDSPARQ
ncbi:MAG: zf-HC2 domain-containing protein [Acidobacteriota bacterium]|nr:zf-HC2 domain-containing protein [Acidobacteriota bacterium]